MNCEWKELKTIKDCCAFREEFFTEEFLKYVFIFTKLSNSIFYFLSLFRKEGFIKALIDIAVPNKCYPSNAMKILAENGLQEEYNAYQTELNQIIKKAMQNGGKELRKINPALMTSLQVIMSGDGNDVQNEVGEGELPMAVMRDRKFITKFMEKEYEKEVVLPNVDGLFGGEPCIRMSDNSKTKIEFQLS